MYLDVGTMKQVFVSHEKVTQYIHFPLFDYKSSKREIRRAIIEAIGMQNHICAT